jgi:hypothetical protein
MRGIVLLLVVVACAACGGSPADGDLVIEPIVIEAVDVVFPGGAPAAHVTGVIGDGCSELHSVAQSRAGTTVTITVLRQRPRDAICTQIARLYDEVIRLEGSYPAGRYVVRVNGVERTFTTP